MKRFLLLLLFLLPVLPAHAAGPEAAGASVSAPDASPLPGQPATLSTRDRSQVAATACAPQGAGSRPDAVQAWREPGSARAVRVRIQCAPHGEQQGVPVFRVMSCDNRSGAWNCNAQTEALRMTLSNGRELAVIPRAMPQPLAIEAVREASKLTIRPFYRPAIDVMTDECAIGPAAAGASSGGMTSYEIRCGQAVIFLTRDCPPSQQCRYFIPFARNY